MNATKTERAMKNKTMTLEELAAMINAADMWELDFDDIYDIIVANGWTAIFDEWRMCHDGKQMIYFDDNGKAEIAPIAEAETNQIDRDLKLFLILEELENSVRERKLTARDAEIKLLEKYEREELEDVLPHRRIEVTDFNHEYFYMENGECVWGEFPRKGKIHDNVEYCKDTQRFEYIEYFVKDEEE